YARATSAPPPGAGLPSQPYRLFAISNVGSLMALLVYPWLIEPRMTIHGQTSGLVMGFAVLALVCGVIAWSIGGTADSAHVSSDAGDRAALPAMQLLSWISLAACGSVLLSAVTNHLSQNVATIPLLWIIPLVAYLLSFVVAFADDRWHPRRLVLILGA